MLTIVQLSDLHLTLGKNKIIDRLQELAAAVASTEASCNFYIVVLSGDIASSGVSEEYEIARNFLARLSSAIKLHSVGATIQFVMVPGNHDCYLPKAGVTLRSALISAIAPTLQTDAPDSATLESILESQKDYFHFREQESFPLDNQLQRVCEVRDIVIEGNTLRFVLYNTALLSTRNERQGQLSVPMKLARSNTLSRKADLVVAIFHHPITWLESNNGIEFREYIEQISDMVLTGHQHADHAFIKQSLSGDVTLYCESDVLQESGSSKSGFRLIQLCLNSSSRRVVSYQWADPRYTKIEDTGWHQYSRAVSRANRPTPLPKFLEFLSDSGVGLTHKTKGAVSLETVFVYPDAFTSPLLVGQTQREIKGKDLLKYLTTESEVVVRGSAFSGKSSLAKTIIKAWLTKRTFYPLLISGRNIKRVDKASIERLIHSSIVDIYGAPSVEPYRQLKLSEKAILIDDWDESELSPTETNRFLEEVMPQFGKVLLFVSSMSFIKYLLAKLKGTELILRFQLLSLKDFSHVARGELIENWLSLELPRDDKSFSRRVEETERLVQSVIGKNTLPSLPLIVLALLQASQRDTEVLPENGSFGYLYEVLITSALSATAHGGKSQLDKKYTFLSLLAYHQFDAGFELITEGKMLDLLDDYSRSYKVRVEKRDLLRDLEKNRVLVKEDGNYSFGYPHYYYYFLARYFKNNINGPDGSRLRKLLNAIAQGLNSGTNGVFLMFFVYLSHDEALIDECVRMGESILSEVSPSDLTNEVEFYNTKDYAGIPPPVAESVDLEAKRRERRQAADDANIKKPDESFELGPGLESDGYSENLPVATKLDYAFRCLELLGQILRNFTGSLPGHRKLAILKTAYRLGLRILRSILTSLADSSVKAREEIGKRDPKKAEDRQFIKQIEDLLTVIGQIVGFSMMQTISLNVGSADIEEVAYVETLEEVGRNDATELLDLAIHLDHFEDYPFNSVKRLNKRLRNNRFAHRVLADLVIENMLVFDIGLKMRQRVLALLKAGRVVDDSILSKAGKRLKKP